jgi:hypothetical protein
MVKSINIKKKKENKISFNDKNLLLDIYKKSHNFIIGLLTISLINIILISFIINYLNNLKKCTCYQDINNKNYSNINYLIIIESIILTLNIIMFILNVYLYNIFKILKKGGGDGGINNSHIIIYIIFIIVLFINIYFIYNVYKLYENVDKSKEKCECSKSFVRYLLYFQVILIIIQSITIIYSSLTLT